MLATSASCHAVHFYRTLDGLGDTVARFIADGLAVGQPGVVIVRPEVWPHIERGLLAHGIEVDDAIARHRLVRLDAATVLEQILSDGRPDPAKARKALESILGRVENASKDGTTRFYGEMAGMLWGSGRRVAALELEELGNASPGHCMVVCGYCAADMPERSADDDICAFHSHVLSATGELTASRWHE